MNKIGLQMAEILIIKAVKTQLFYFITYVFYI